MGQQEAVEVEFMVEHVGGNRRKEDLRPVGIILQSNIGFIPPIYITVQNDQNQKLIFLYDSFELGRVEITVSFCQRENSSSES